MSNVTKGREVALYYFNVRFGLRLVSDFDEMAFGFLARNIQNGTFKPGLESIRDWCVRSHIAYNASFEWRDDYPSTENVDALREYLVFKGARLEA